MRGHSISVKVKTVEYFLNNIYNSILSCIKVLILSRYKISLPQASQKDCIILGNGPSLKQSLACDADLFKRSPLICVNNFATTMEFIELRPSHYVILDPGFFIDKTRTDIFNTFNALKNNVSWDINLFVPYKDRKDQDIQFLIKNSSFVKIHFYNYVVFKGFKTLAFQALKKNLAMPQFYNVLGPSILLAINMGYKEINIVGADHSWFENISIREDNVLCRRDVHFYDEKTPALIPMVDPISKKTENMGNFFLALSRIFNSYYLLNEYALTRNCSIYNISPNSYIDAFKRKKYNIA